MIAANYWSEQTDIYLEGNKLQVGVPLLLVVSEITYAPSGPQDWNKQEQIIQLK